MINKETIEKILSLAEIQTIDYDGLQYTKDDLSIVRKPSVDCLTVKTLKSFVDYTKNTIDTLPKIMIVIESHKIVSLLSAFDEKYKQREYFIQAKYDDINFNYNHNYSSGDFIIKLQTCFIKTETISSLMKVVGNIKEESSTQVKDDGVTQSVVAKTGIARVEEVDLPNPVKLKPYRTFLEIDQPESLFTLRMESGHRIALYEADGGMWKMQARESIAKYLKKELSDIQIIS